MPRYRMSLAISTCPSLVTRLQHSALNRAPIRIHTDFFFTFNDISSHINSCSHRSSSRWRAVTEGATNSVFSRIVPKTLPTRSFWDIRLQNCCDLENRVRGPWRSLEMSRCDRAHMTSYWRSIGGLYLVSFLRYSSSKNVVTLKWRSMVTQGHWEWYHSIDFVWFPISVL